MSMTSWWYRVLTAFAGVKRIRPAAEPASGAKQNDSHSGASTASAAPPERHTWRTHGGSRH
ncbi:MAG TPA: hypothetical protein PLO53_14955 [Candidatus Hydrogenedentes bacterium]|nr:hypothetical protein [Candidatus Hydrogenedentota bacterium]HPU99239.1 hypothetical protein [Candidatus Hydrogenedentota bacterium]